MASGSWAAKGNTEIVAADEYRNILTIQLTNSTPAALGFGEAAEVDRGILLINAGDQVTVHGHFARGAVFSRANVLGLSASGIWQDGELEYKPGPQVAS